MSAISNRFLSAVRLCTGPMTIKRRLTQAWLEYLDPIDPDDLPSEVRPQFIELRKAMYARIPLPRENAPQASVRKMSIREVSDHSDNIVMIYRELMRQSAGVSKAEKRTFTDRKRDYNFIIVGEINNDQQEEHEQRLN